MGGGEIVVTVLLSFGHGYSSRALAALLSPKWEVIGTNRSGMGAVKWPGTDMGPFLDRASHLLISAAPGEDGDPVLRELRDEITQRAKQFQWVGYLSTTGVYGDRDGEWVTEADALRPATSRGQRRVEAEAAWAKIEGLALHVFRLAGIYGPGRGPFSKVRDGTARRIVKPGQVFSRIHVADIAQVLLASIRQPNPGAVYNVCDDDPAPPQEVIAEAARLLGLPLPPEESFETARMSPMARSFYAESKRVSNAKIKEELGVTLFYPDYRSGLQALLEAEQAGTTNYST